MEREIFSTVRTECCGRKEIPATNDGTTHITRFENALKNPVHPIIITYRDNAREVLCPHFLGGFGLDGKGCGAATPVLAEPSAESAHMPTHEYPPCAYESAQPTEHIITRIIQRLAAQI
jgi:hypothetical protein